MYSKIIWTITFVPDICSACVPDSYSLPFVNSEAAVQRCFEKFSRKKNPW